MSYFINIDLSSIEFNMHALRMRCLITRRDLTRTHQYKENTVESLHGSFEQQPEKSSELNLLFFLGKYDPRTYEFFRIILTLRFFLIRVE